MRQFSPKIFYLTVKKIPFNWWLLAGSGQHAFDKYKFLFHVDEKYVDFAFITALLVLSKEYFKKIFVARSTINVGVKKFLKTFCLQKSRNTTQSKKGLQHWKASRKCN